RINSGRTKLRRGPSYDVFAVNDHVNGLAEVSILYYGLNPQLYLKQGSVVVHLSKGMLFATLALSPTVLLFNASEADVTLPAIKGINQRRAKLLINELENKPQVRLEYWNSKREAEEKVEPRYPRTPGIIKKFGDFYGAGSVINMTIRLPKSAAELHAMLVRPDLGDAVERRSGIDVRDSKKNNGIAETLPKDLQLALLVIEKLDVVGRTGAGKSSLTLALFMLAGTHGNTGGSIEIDGVDISTLGLHQLRRHLSIIPHEPTLFVGTVPDNLNPFHEHQDSELRKALDRAHLKPHMSILAEGLSFIVAPNGENVSARQRSLICLARALLRKNKILGKDVVR
ncbi:Multidrug resistance-associated protein 1, partial [Mortierella sp. GBA43]